MARLIDKDALAEKMRLDMCMECIGGNCNNCDYDRALTAIEDAPTVDAVEVVRCKDCALRGREDCAMFYRCDCGAQHTWETNNDYCSCGERKESE